MSSNEYTKIMCYDVFVIIILQKRRYASARTREVEAVFSAE